jgi:hypothetical protein
MWLRPRLLQQPRRDLTGPVDIWGAGRAVRAIMTVAALQGSKAKFRVWCRHHSRAELLRIHLADLPPLDVEIEVAVQPSPGGTGPLVLALGQRTSRRSRQKSKDALFEENLAIIEGLLPVLAGRTVVVVTNPSTRLTARLCSDGINALGIGVMNDQLRFERDAGASLRLVGAHNPFELGFGQLGHGLISDPMSFSRLAYRDLANRQDRQRPLLDPDGMLARLIPGLHETAWQRLGAMHGGLDHARRWYARQRLASRYLENGIACGRATLALVDFLGGALSIRPDITVEAPMRLADGRSCVMGWPWDGMTGQPRALAFDQASCQVLDALATRYALAIQPVASEALTLHARGMPMIRCIGTGLEALVADVVPLAAPMPGTSQISTPEIEITILDDPATLPARIAGLDAPLREVAQHRGKNAFEHRDLTIETLAGNRRLMNFSASGARALIDDDSRQITLAVAPGPGRRDEFRKLLRDQILTPAYAASGAWVLHAGLVGHGGDGLLLLGDSGAGKTTGALHLLAGRQGGYGASERVLVFMREGRLMALGVPESLTIFRGSLRGLANFEDLLAGHDPSADWTRANKLRLSRDDVVARLGSYQIAEPMAVSQVALVRYAADAVPSRVAAATPEARLAALHGNDLTTEDDVRAAWLEWYQPSRDQSVAAAMTDPDLPFTSIDWSEPSALADALAGHF